MTIQSIKPGFILLEFITGLVFGLLGAFIYIEFFDEKGLFGSILYTIIVACIAMFIGIILIGYFHFRNIKRIKEFGGALIWSFLIFLPFFFLSLTLAIGRITMLLPLIGAVIGLNVVLFKKVKKEEITDSEI